MALRGQFAAQLGVGDHTSFPQQKPPPLVPDEPAEEPSEWDKMAWWEKGLDLLNRGAAASAGAAHAMVTGGNPIHGAWKGFAGHERKNYSDVLGAMGMDEGLARAAVGFGMDVALDPTTYVTFGTGAGEKVAVGGVEKTLTEGAQVARVASEEQKAHQALRVLNRLDESGRSSMKDALLERFGLKKYADLPNEPVAKVMGERTTAEGLGRVAEGKAVAGPLADIQGTQPFKTPTLRFAGMPIIPEDTMAAVGDKLKSGWNAAEQAKTIGPVLKGVRQGGEDVGNYLKKLFSASTGNAALDEMRAGARDTLDYQSYSKMNEYMGVNGKGGIAEHMNELAKGDPKVYQEAKRQVRGYLQGVSEVKTRQIPDVAKQSVIASSMESLTQQLADLRLSSKREAAAHGASIDLLKGEQRKGSMEYIGAVSEHEKSLNKAAIQEAKEQSQLLKDQHELAYGDFKRELKSRGVGQVFGISKDEYEQNIPRQYRRKAGLGIDQWIDELKTRGKLGPGATESDFYDLIKKAHTPPGTVDPEAVRAGVKSEATAAKISQLETEAAARRKELVALQAKNPTAQIDPKIKKIEAEIAELKAQPTPTKPEEYAVKKLPDDPKLAKLAQDIEGRMQKVHAAEQRLPLPPEARQDYFPHILKDEVKPALRKAISQDAWKTLTKEYSAGLGSSQRRTLEGLVDDITVQHLIDSGHVDPVKLKEVLEKKGITATPDQLLAFETDPVKAALARELQSIRALNANDFAHEVLSSPHFVASKVMLGDENKIRHMLSQNPDHALYIPSSTYIQHFMDKAQQEALREGGPHGKAKNLIEEVFAHALPDLVKTPQQQVATGYILRKETAEHLASAYSNQFNDEVTKNFLKLWDKGTNYFKTFQTLANPGFYTRNMASYFWQAGIMAGAKDPSTWGKAAMAMKDPSKVANIGKYTAAEAIDLAKRNGIFRQGYISQDLTDTLDRMLNPSKNPFSASGPIARHGGDLVQNIDNWARTALFFDGLEKGMDVQSSIMRTKKYLFDMGDFSKTEKQLFKRVIPFYSWTRKSIPLALESMVTQPGKVSVLSKIRSEAESNVDGALDNKYVSEFIRDNMGVPIYKDAAGKVQYFLMGRWIPTMDIQRLDPKEVFSMLHPLIKEPIEQMMNYNVFSGKPISQFPGELQKMVGIPMNARLSHLARNVGVLQEIDKAFFRNDMDPISTPATAMGLTTYGQDKAAQMKRTDNDINHEIWQLKATQAAAQAKYGDDSVITKQYVQRIADLQAQQTQIKEDLSKIEPQLQGMKKPSRAPSPIAAKLQKASGPKHRTLSPHIQKLIGHKHG